MYAGSSARKAGLGLYTGVLPRRAVERGWNGPQASAHRQAAHMGLLTLGFGVSRSQHCQDMCLGRSAILHNIAVMYSQLGQAGGAVPEDLGLHGNPGWYQWVASWVCKVAEVFPVPVYRQRCAEHML